MTAAKRLSAVLTSALLVVAVLCGSAASLHAQEWKAHGVPLFVATSNPSGYQGFVRVINHSDEAGEVLIDAIDDTGVPYGPVTLAIGAGETVHFNSGDFEDGNAGKGLSRGIGTGEGNWRLRLRSQLDLEVLAYNRTSDGLLAPLHDLVPGAVVHRPSTGEEAMGHRVVIFNPSSNVNQVSRLRIINRGEETATVTIEGIDDDGVSPGTAVEVEVPAGASRTVTAQELESGEGEGLAGMLDDGQGKWQLVVTADQPVEVMSLLTSPTGHLTNLSTEPEAGEGGAGAEYEVPLFAAAANADGYQGFVRIINRSGGAGEVSVEAFDDAGDGYGPVTLDIGANETVHFNSGDLEEGNPDKGLLEGIGAGDGDWRLTLRSDLDLEVLAYNRTDDGLLTTLHDLVPYTEVVRPAGEEVQGHYVAIFNPASNVNQVSRVRIVNPGAEPAAVTIEGIDDGGASPGTAVELSVPVGASRTLTSQALESGQWEAESGVSGGLGDGKGKWRLAVTSEQAIKVMSLLSSPTGHLVNLSTAAPGGVAVPPPVVPIYAAIEITGKSTASVGTPVALSVKSVGTSDVTIERYEWVFSDGQRESGEEVSVSFAGAGVHDVTVSAMSGTDLVAQTTWAVSVFDAGTGANPGFEGIPTIFGDVDRDGRFGSEDAELAEQAVAGLQALEDEAIEAGDLDLSGTLEKRDVELMRQALDSGAALPSALLDESAYPGGVVAMVSPALRNADADIEVFVDGVPSPRVMRAILGYATFAVPASLAGEDAGVEVVVEADGVVAERLQLLLKPAVTPTVSAKEDVVAFLVELTEVIADQEQAGADFIAQSEGLTEDDAAIVLGAAKAAVQQLEAATAEIEALLNAEGGEELATILQAALYANGLAEFRESLRTGPKSIGTQASTGNQVSPLVAAVCDKYVPAICKLKIANAETASGVNVAKGFCTAAGLVTAVGTIVTGLNPAVATGLGYVSKICLPFFLGAQIAQLIGELVESVTLGVRLTSDQVTLQQDKKATIKATIKAEVTFGGLQHLCGAKQEAKVSKGVVGRIVKGITRFLLTKSDNFGFIRAILRKTSSEKFIEKVFEDAVGRALTVTRLDKVFEKYGKTLCDLVGLGQVTDEKLAFGLTADGSEFNLKAFAGTRPLSMKEFGPKNDGSGTYSLACPEDFSGTLLVKGNKYLCDETKRAEVRVSCANVCTGVEVDIPDAALRAVIEMELGKAAGVPITPAEMARLSDFRAGSRGIQSLAGLECATGLTVLDLENNQIRDVSHLSGLAALEAMALNDNQITDVSPLSDLTGLVELGLSNNQITDVSPLSGLTALEAIYLDDNQITDVSPLSGLTGLVDLFLSNNQISDVAPLAGLTALEYLDLADNKVKILALSGLKELSWLDAANNQITNVVLSDLKELSWLDAANNQITNVVLSDLKELSWLDLANNQITNMELAGLKELSSLFLANNQIMSVAPLAGLKELFWVDLANNQIMSVAPLAGLKRLFWVDLANNQIASVAPLSGITLKWFFSLDLSYNQITDIGPFIPGPDRSLDLAGSLYLRGNPLNDISVNTHIPELRSWGISVYY